MWFFRVLSLVAPVVVFAFALRVGRELQASGATPLRDWDGAVVIRAPDGDYVEVTGGGHAEREPTHRAPEREEW